MKKEQKFFLAVVAILIILLSVIAFFAIRKKASEPHVQTDALKFKEEYEKLNNVVNESNGKKYLNVELDDLNPFVYKTEDEVIKILKGGSGIIYFGYSSCPWCRNIVPILNKAALSTGIEQITYLDIYDMRSTLQLDDNDRVIVKREGSENYKRILELMNSVLEDFYLTNSDGEQIKTNEKRLYAPTVVTVKEGKIVDIHVSSVDTQTDPYSEMTKEQGTELFKKYTSMFTKFSGTTCDEAC